MDEICEDTGHAYTCDCPPCHRYWYWTDQSYYDYLMAGSEK